MSQKHFDQKQKLDIIESSQEIGVKEAAKIAEVHYTTVYDWKRLLKAQTSEMEPTPLPSVAASLRSVDRGRSSRGRCRIEFMEIK